MYHLYVSHDTYSMVYIAKKKSGVTRFHQLVVWSTSTSMFGIVLECKAEQTLTSLEQDRSLKGWVRRPFLTCLNTQWMDF